MLEKSKTKGGNIPSFANNMGQSCWQSWAFLTSLASFASFANSFGPGCWQSWAPLKHAPTLPTASAHAVGKENCWQNWASLPTASRWKVLLTIRTWLWVEFLPNF
jgi:hypothetical protein